MTRYLLPVASESGLVPGNRLSHEPHCSVYVTLKGCRTVEIQTGSHHCCNYFWLSRRLDQHSKAAIDQCHYRPMTAVYGTLGARSVIGQLARARYRFRDSQIQRLSQDRQPWSRAPSSGVLCVHGKLVELHDFEPCVSVYLLVAKIEA